VVERLQGLVLTDDTVKLRGHPKGVGYQAAEETRPWLGATRGMVRMPAHVTMDDPQPSPEGPLGHGLSSQTRWRWARLGLRYSRSAPRGVGCLRAAGDVVDGLDKC
jgi:hypothetical protein